MTILACDTANQTASVALLEEGKVLAEFSIHDKKTHSEKLLPMIAQLLETTGKAPSDIDVFAISEGPGSFTGLRIGLVTMKTMAYTLKKPIVGIGTLYALAATVPFFNGLVCPVLDARNQQAFCGFYRNLTLPISRQSTLENDFQNELFLKEHFQDKNAAAAEAPLKETGRFETSASTTFVMAQASLMSCAADTVCHVDVLAEALIGYKQDVLLLGDCATAFADRIRSLWAAESHPYHLFVAPESLFKNRAATVALLAQEKIQSGTGADVFSMQPFYMRVSQAERFKQQKKGSAKGEHTKNDTK